jgi:ribokinase
MPEHGHAAGETYDLLAVGDVMLDVHVPVAPGDAVLHDAIHVCAGGSAVNAARAARRLGARAAVAGRIGDDAAGAAVAADLRDTGVATFLETHESIATGTVVYVGAGVVADRGANAGFIPTALPPARATLVSGYLDTDAIAASLAHATGLRAVDVQRTGRDGLDAEIVLGAGLDLDRFAGRHEVVCTTLGAHGAVAVAGAERVEVRPPRLLDTSPPGAGDAFAAAFLLALASGRPLRACVEEGCAAAVGR